MDYLYDTFVFDIFGYFVLSLNAEDRGLEQCKAK